VIEEDASISIRDTQLQTYQYNIYFVKFNLSSYLPIGRSNKVLDLNHCSKKKRV